ncbi:hypothetical protein E4U44_003284 [Claviceps purpurea]|nr:hypothetical protein E4U44_003284 [Claviceps purpurea]
MASDGLKLPPSTDKKVPILHFDARTKVVQLDIILNRSAKADTFLSKTALRNNVDMKVGHYCHVFEEEFDGKKGPKTIHLTLNDVAVVPNFHVNIVSEGRLRDKGVWLCGSDNTSRHEKFDKATTLIN